METIKSVITPTDTLPTNLLTLTRVTREGGHNQAVKVVLGQILCVYSAALSASNDLDRGVGMS